MIRTYIEWIVELPWGKSTEDKLDLKAARRQLDKDHYDIDRIKERIIEFLAVRKLKPDARSGIIVFVGPPGVGKTSLGKSIAAAMGRKFERISRRRRARRVGDPRPPPHLHRRDAGRDHPRAARRGVEQPGADDRRDRQDGRGLPRRPGQRDARGARPGAEHRVPRPLPGPAVRPLERHVHLHGEPARDDPGAAARSDGDHRALGLHRGAEARDREALPGAAPDRAQRPDQVEDRDHRQGARADHRGLHARGRRAQPRAPDRIGLPQGCARVRRRQAQAQARQSAPRSWPSCSARAGCRATCRAGPTRRAWRPAWRGRRSAATSCSSRRRPMPATASCRSPVS